MYLTVLYFERFCPNAMLWLGITLKNAVFWDVTPCGSCNSRHFGGICRPNHQGDKHRRARNSISSN
jgi:hypothetical protein